MGRNPYLKPFYIKDWNERWETISLKLYWGLKQGYIYSFIPQDSMKQLVLSFIEDWNPVETVPVKPLHNWNN